MTGLFFTQFAKLSAVMLMVALFTSRVTLVLHEFVGHGAIAVLFGSKITNYHLYLFAGGYIEFDRATPFGPIENLCIQLGGVALELFLGALALVGARFLNRGSLAQVVVIGYAGINVVHALFYASSGCFHGYGDGAVLYRLLGASRAFIAVPLAVIATIGSYVLARQLSASIRGWLPGLSSRMQLILLAGSMVIACGTHATLALVELQVAETSVYGRIMTSQNERTVQSALRRYAEQSRQDRGTPPTQQELHQLREQLRKQHRQLPFRMILIIAILAAMTIGAIRSRPFTQQEPSLLPWRQVGYFTLATMAALLLVVLLRDPM